MIQPQAKTTGNAEKAYRMLGNENLWNVAMRCHELLKGAGVPHSVAGEVAVACMVTSETQLIWICWSGQKTSS